MHVFLQGPRGIGKSTVIQAALELLAQSHTILLGGFFTWNGGADDPNIYIRPAEPGAVGERYRIASYGGPSLGMVCDSQIFDTVGARILRESAQGETADLIVMDELGYLESDAEAFKRAVFETLSGDTPVLGVLRSGDVPWHEPIKRDPRVMIYNVNEENRGDLPREVIRMLDKKA